MYSQRKTVWPIYVSLTLIFGIITFGSGYGVGIIQKTYFSEDNIQKQFSENAQVNITQNADENINFDLFWEVWNLVKDKHIAQPVEDIDLFYGAMAGIADSVGDPYTSYLSPELTARFNENISGKFEGIGAEIGVKESQLQIIAPLAGTPAEQAGLLAGDNIFKIDGVDTLGMSLDEAVERIRGDEGTTVVLTIFRSGADDVIDISVVRETIKIPTVEYEVTEYNGKRVGVITLSHFNEDAANDFSEVAQQVLRDNPSGIILDLRNNPGGLLQESVEIASHFIEDGKIVTERFSNGDETSYNSKGYATLNNFKTVVLINQGSASAAEIVAGALQDYSVATIVGNTSYGKGSVQDYQILEDNSSLKITVAHWFTPNGNTINDQGITPDIEVDRTFEEYESDIDPQLDRALEELTN